MSATWSPKYLKLASSLLKPASINQKSTFFPTLAGFWPIGFEALGFRFQGFNQSIRATYLFQWHKKLVSRGYRDLDISFCVKTLISVKISRKFSTLKAYISRPFEPISKNSSLVNSQHVSYLEPKGF